MRRLGRTMTTTCLCALAGLSIILASVGCAPRQRGVVKREAPPPSFEDVVQVYNERAERLDRVWGRAVVELKYRDEKDRRQREQGEGHLQIRQPHEFALSVGKLGETYAWLGCDEERFWFFDRFDEPRVTVGRHDNVGRVCAEPLSLPADPAQMIDLMGITPIPLDSDGRTAWSEDGRWLVVSYVRAGAIERIYLDSETMLPNRIEFLAPDGTVDLVSVLENNSPVEQGDEGGFYPRMASRIDIMHVSSEAQVIIHLADLEDGSTGRGKLRDGAFEFETLVGAFAPRDYHVLDRDCEVPAWTQ